MDIRFFSSKIVNGFPDRLFAFVAFHAPTISPDGSSLVHPIAKSKIDAKAKTRNFFIAFFLLSGVFFLMFQGTAFAVTDTDFVSKIVSEFYNKTSTWEPTIKKYALILFRWLVTFEVCFLGIRVAMGRENIADAFKQFVTLLLMAGFFLAVINNYREWSWNLINGLAAVGDELGAPRTATDAPFITGLRIIDVIFSKISIQEPINSLGLIIGALVVLICFALISAFVVLVKCEAMIAMAAALILVGFGGSSMFRNYAENSLRYVFSVAFKLFVMQILLGVGISFITGFDTTTAELQDVFVIIGASIVLLALVKSIPDVVSGIINGSHVTSGSALTAAGAAVGGAALGAGMAVASGGKSLSAASKMADIAGATGVGKMAHMAQNLWSARQEAKNGGRPTTSSIMQERLNSARLSGE